MFIYVLWRSTVTQLKRTKITQPRFGSATLSRRMRARGAQQREETRLTKPWNVSTIGLRNFGRDFITSSLRLSEAEFEAVFEDVSPPSTPKRRRVFISPAFSFSLRPFKVVFASSLIIYFVNFMNKKYIKLSTFKPFRSHFICPYTLSCS